VQRGTGNPSPPLPERPTADDTVLISRYSQEEANLTMASKVRECVVGHLIFEYREESLVELEKVTILVPKVVGGRFWNSMSLCANWTRLDYVD
jgi:hypothetical protein